MMSEKEKRVIESVRILLPGFDIREIEIEKCNDQKHRGIRIAQEGAAIGFVIYWEDVERLCGSDYMESEAAEFIMDMVKRHLIGVDIPSADMMDWNLVKTNVYKKVVNFEKSKGYLEKVVNQRYLDLAETYYIKLEVRGRRASAEVTRELLSCWGITEKELFIQAEENMDREGYGIWTMQEVLERLGGMSLQQDIPMYIITNKTGVLGAAAITRPDIVKGLLGDMDGDYYVLPASIHEIILCPAEEYKNVEGLKNMVYEMNRAVVKEEEALSDSVYYYHAGSGMIDIG